MADLCTLEDVRTAMRLRDEDTKRDVEIAEAITFASAAITDETRREFTQSDDEARKVGFDPTSSNSIALDPWDLRSVTTLTLHPGSSDEKVLSASEFVLTPVKKSSGVYTGLTVAAGVVNHSKHMTDFGFAVASILGDWGFPEVPRNVARATVITVIAWLRKDVQALGSPALPDGQRGDLPQLVANFAIPPDAWRLLGPYARRSAF